MKHIFDLYPQTKQRFFSWMIGEYGVVERDFYIAPLDEQGRAIARFLGYPLAFPDQWTELDIFDSVSDYIYKFEITLTEYIGEVPDPLKEMNAMDSTERETRYPDMHTQRKIPGSINMALIPISKDYTMNITILQSLQNAIVDYFDVNAHRMASLAEEENFINNLIKNPLKNEDVPF